MLSKNLGLPGPAAGFCHNAAMRLSPRSVMTIPGRNMRVGNEVLVVANPYLGRFDHAHQYCIFDGADYP